MEGRNAATIRNSEHPQGVFEGGKEPLYERVLRKLKPNGGKNKLAVKKHREKNQGCQFPHGQFLATGEGQILAAFKREL